MPLMECIEGFVELVSMQIIDSWDNRRVIINKISFRIMVEVIEKVGGLSLEGKIWRN